MSLLFPALFVLSCSDKEPVDSTPAVFYAEPAECGEGVAAGSVEGLLRWPYVQSVTTNSAIVAWGGAAESAAGELRWSRDDGYAESAAAQATPTQISDAADPEDEDPKDTGPDMTPPLETLQLYHVEITGLEPGTEYCYAVSVDGVTLASGLKLRTAPEHEAAPVSFFAIGDFGSGSETQIAVRDQMLNYEADLFLTTGDNAYSDGNWGEYQYNVFVPYQQIMTRSPMYPVPGNHDYKTDRAAPMLANFFLPEQALRTEDQERYWSVEWGPLHVIGLDSEGPILETGESETDDMLDWLEKTLTEVDKPWTVLSWHKPAYSNHQSRDPDIFMLGLVVPILEAHGVDVVLQGHNHFYERSFPLSGNAGARDDDGITYVVTGGGGASVYDLLTADDQAAGVMANHFMWGEADDCSFTMKAIDQAGATIDSFTLERCD